ncbi:hypothetical protein LOTGIDRAFT_137402, partial [Lottia gigantea]
ISEIRELFRIFDKNHDNTISSNELGKVLKCMGMQMSDEEIGMYMEELDKEGNGRIEYREFHSFMQEELKKAEDPAHREQAVRSAFKVFDKESDGLIELSEFKSTMKTLGEPLTDEELDDMLKIVNVTEDGKINYEGKLPFGYFNGEGL